MSRQPEPKVSTAGGASHSTGRPLCRLGALRQAAPAKLLRVPVFSPSLGLRRWCAVWIPPDFTPRRRYPVAYLFRGHHSEWCNPREDPSRRRMLSLQVEEAVAKGDLPPVVLVIPCLGADDRTFHTIPADWSARHLAPSAPGMGLGRFETHLTRELFPRIEGALGLEEPHRIAIGFSLGGLTAFILAWRHPGLFQDVAAYDGSFFYDPPDSEDSILNHPMFDPVLGKPRDPALVKAHSPIWLARNLPYVQLERSRYYIQSGPATSEPDDSNYDRDRCLVDALAGRNLRNQVDQVVPHGSHNWYTADEFAMRILRRVLP